MRLLVIRSRAEIGVKSRSTLVVKTRRGEREHPLRDADAVLIIGSGIKLDSSVPPVLSLHNIPLAIMAKDHVSILVNPVMTRYNNYRRLQYSLDKKRALGIALEYLKARVLGTLNILKYYKRSPPSLPEPPYEEDDAGVFEKRIRLWEATVSNLLWDHIFSLLRPRYLEELRTRYGFTGRKPRHPDPLNKTLSVMYSVLYSLATKALIAAGLDPTHGLLHRTLYSTPLTFDYTEQFKPIAIQATIDLINTDGLPKMAPDGELERESVNKAIKNLYDYLTLRHTKTRKTPYQYIFLKAYCLAKHLEDKCPRHRLAITWDRRNHK